MSTLANLRPSITEMPQDAVLALFMEIRKDRRRVRIEKAQAQEERATKRKEKTRQSSVLSLATSLDSLSENALEEMIEMMQNLTNQLGGIDGSSSNQVQDARSSADPNL